MAVGGFLTEFAQKPTVDNFFFDVSRIQNWKHVTFQTRRTRELYTNDLCSASYVGCQRDTARVCCWTQFVYMPFTFARFFVFFALFCLYMCIMFFFVWAASYDGLMHPLAACQYNSWHVLSMLCTWHINSLSLLWRRCWRAPCCRSISPAGTALSSKPAAAADGRTDKQTNGWTDARQFHRPCFAYYASSITNTQQCTP